MFCSTIIPTIGRPSLDRAVESVLEQTITSGSFEVIVVNDSGRPLPKAHWQQAGRVQILNVDQHERSVARNAGAALAKGDYLHFLDDDDWLLPGALDNLHKLAERNHEAVWLVGVSKLVNRNGENVLELHHNIHGNCFIQVMAGEWIPLQSSLIRANAFFAVGGFRPIIIGQEDIDLSRRIILHGDVDSVSEAVACIQMGDEGSTTNRERGLAQSRWAREDVLNQPGVCTRLRAAVSNSYWHGRVTRVYLTSMVWNLQHRRVFTASSRLLFGLFSVVMAARHLLKPAYWHALIKPYISFTFLNGFQMAKEKQTDDQL